jgi:molecular chaperone GrpE
MRPQDEEPQGPVIRDRRRIDPVTGQVRDTNQAGQAPRGPGQPRPGRHSVSKPGGGAGANQAGSPPAAETGAPSGASGSGGSGASGSGASGSGASGSGASGSGASGSGASGSSASGSGASGSSASGSGAGQQNGAADRLAVQLAERTADLQRLQAEYANYRKRVDRDRLAVREQALANVLTELLPVLDDIGLAREHGELTGGFKSVAESLEGVATKLGLTSYGESGDPFDPNLHEALMHSYSAEVMEPSCVRILQPGYKVGDRILRPARVAVAEPGDDDTDDDTAGQDGDSDDAAASAGDADASGGPGAAKSVGEDGGGDERDPESGTGGSASGATKKN